nr:MAG TPA: hypothetical protein [Caudoviricetes sp.]
MAHKHPVYDTDPHFKIDGDTRVIINMSDVKVALMQGDHNSERFTFEIPRYVDGHDMSLCNICQIHYLNVASSTRATNPGVYEVEDLQFDPKDEQNRVVLSWLISSNVTMYVGSLSFVIRFGCSTNGVVDYIWNTAVHSGITISSSICNSETVVQDYTDILEQWRDKLFSTYESIIDKTLTKSGQAADAKVTGDSVTALKEDLSDLSESVNGIELSKNLLDNSSVIENKRPSNWAGQTINDSYKTDGYYTFRAIPVTQNSTYYFVENGDLVNFGQLATYDKDGKYVSLLSPSVFNVNGVKVGYIIPENVAYVRGESKTSNFYNVNFKLFNGRFEKKFLKYNESAYDGKNLPVIVFDFDQVFEIDARFTILKKYGFAGNVVETATNNYEITKELIKMGYDISPYLGNHTWDYSTEDGIQKLTANIAEKLGGLEAVGIYNPTMISCSGHKYSDTMEKILSSYKIDYVRCSGFIKDGVSKGKSMYENSYGTRIVVPIGLGSYNGVDEFNTIIDSLVDGNVPLIMPFMHTFGYDADWITQEAFEKVVSHVSELVKNGKALCMNMHDFVAYNDAVKSIHDDYIRNMSAIFN